MRVHRFFSVREVYKSSGRRPERHKLFSLYGNYLSLFHVSGSMAFDMEEDGVRQLRQKYRGVNPSAEEVLETAAYLQDRYVNDSAGIGNLTTVEGAQSTKTRRPLSASVDLIVDGSEGLDSLGEDYDSWSHMGGYFADVNDLEVGIIDVSEFPVWDFPDEALRNSYGEEVSGYDVVLAEPGSNAASKFNRMTGGEVVKNSDAVDLAGHLHWASGSTRTSVDEIASRVDEHVEGPYEEAYSSLWDAEENFSKGERERFRDAVKEFGSLLGIEDE